MTDNRQTLDSRIIVRLFVPLWLQAIWTMSFNVVEVCERIVQSGLYADMLANLSWDSLSSEALNDPKSGTKRDFVEAHIATLHNVLRKTDSARPAFRQHHAINVVQKFRDCSEFPVIFLLGRFFRSLANCRYECKRHCHIMDGSFVCVCVCCLSVCYTPLILHWLRPTPTLVYPMSSMSYGSFQRIMATALSPVNFVCLLL